MGEAGGLCTFLYRCIIIVSLFGIDFGEIVDYKPAACH